MLVTAYTDASLGKSASWAIWLRSEQGRVIRQGLCPENVGDIFAAELWAMKEAIECAHHEWPNSGVILLNSDSLSAINALKADGNWSAREDVAMIQESVWSFAFAKYLTLRFKHVKAHTGRDDVRSYLNRAVDQKAKAARRLASRDTLAQ